MHQAKIIRSRPPIHHFTLNESQDVNASDGNLSACGREVLSAPAQTVATAAAILGSAFRFEDLAAVAGLEEMTALTSLDDLLIRSIFQEERHGTESRYVFSHEKMTS